MIVTSDRFLAVVPSLADSSESVSGQRPNTSVEQGWAFRLEKYLFVNDSFEFLL